MTDRSWILVDLVVVATHFCLVSEEVDGRVLHSTRLLGIVLKVLQAVCLIPACWEDVERELSSNRVSAKTKISILMIIECRDGTGREDLRKAHVRELLSQLANKGLSDLVDLVILLKVKSLLEVSITADWADIDHAIAELDECTALDGNVEIGDVVQYELDQLLVVLLAKVADEGLR